MQALHQDPRVTHIGYIGTKRGLEARIIPRYSFIEFFAIRMRGFERRFSFKNFLAVFELAVGLLQTLFILWRFRPHLIIGMGGYASFPALFWSSLFGIKAVIHEQNYFPGLVNRVMAPWVNKVLLAHGETARFLKAKAVAVVGVPIRKEILEARKNYERFGLDPHKKTLLVMGGSNGSQTLTQHILACSPQLQAAQILLITGSQEIHARALPSSVSVERYIDDIGSALACADLVICRAGASTLAELLALEKPAIVVPWAGAAENHQHWNARALLTERSYRVIAEAQLDPQSLVKAIRQLLADSNGKRSESDATCLMRNSTRLFLKEVESLLQNVSTLTGWHFHRRRQKTFSANGSEL